LKIGPAKLWTRVGCPNFVDSRARGIWYCDKRKSGKLVLDISK